MTDPNFDTVRLLRTGDDFQHALSLPLSGLSEFVKGEVYDVPRADASMLMIGGGFEPVTDVPPVDATPEAESLPRSGIAIASKKAPPEEL